MKTILVIEDEKGLSASLSHALRDAGFRCVTSSTGEEGLREARLHPFDLILLDLILPGMSGVEVLKSLKQDEQTSRIPVIVLTNVENPEMIGEVVAVGKTDYLVKSNYSLDEIVERIGKKILDARQQRKG